MRKKQPTDLTRQAWKRALKETIAAVGNKDLSMLAAGVAYFGTLAFFPTLAALVSIYALFASHSQILALGDSAKHLMPSAMAELVTRLLIPLSEDTNKTIIGGAVALLIALVSAASGVENLIKALNRSYDVEERRSFIRLKLTSLIFMALFILLSFPILGLIALDPKLLAGWGMSSSVALGLSIARWPLLILIITLVLAVVYRYAPDRREPRWSIVSWGGAAATLVWTLGTGLFFIYVQFFASFNKTYGIFAGLIILMSWLNLSALIVLLGAEINHRLEEETEPQKKLGRWSPRRLFSRG